MGGTPRHPHAQKTDVQREHSEEPTGPCGHRKQRGRPAAASAQPEVRGSTPLAPSKKINDKKTPRTKTATTNHHHNSIKEENVGAAQARKNRFHHGRTGRELTTGNDVCVDTTNTTHRSCETRLTACFFDFLRRRQQPPITTKEE